MADTRWRGLLVPNPDPSFLRRCLQAAPCRSSPFAGFITQTPKRRRGGLPETCLVPGPRPVFGPGSRLLSYFIPGMDDSAAPLTSRHGLLLVRKGGLLIVCNLLTGEYKSLPSLEHNWRDPDCLVGYALLTDTDCSRSEDEAKPPFFKVLIIIIERRFMAYRLYTFSSLDEWGWNMSNVDVEHQDRIGAMLRQHEAVVCGGAVHWFFGGGSGFYTLDVDARTDHFSITRLHNVKPGDLVRPDTYDVPYLSVDDEGSLVLLCLQLDGSQLEIRRWHEDSARPLITRLEPRTQQKKTKRLFGWRQSWPQQTGMSQIIDGRSRRLRLVKKQEKNRTREGEEGWAHKKFPNSYQGTVNLNCLEGRSMALIQTAPQTKQRYTCLGEKNGTLLIKGDDQHIKEFPGMPLPSLGRFWQEYLWLFRHLSLNMLLLRKFNKKKAEYVLFEESALSKQEHNFCAKIFFTDKAYGPLSIKNGSDDFANWYSSAVPVKAGSCYRKL
uniref:Uncharacterized protein n=1 Tax=Aegilops tauschii TaxID=37682 RepID=M8C8G0_AEGTA